MHCIDLSLSIASNENEPAPVDIEYIAHADGAKILGEPLGLQAKDFPGGFAISTEYITLSSHTGTHIDAPLHYGPLCENEPSKSVDQLPLSWFFSDAVVLRFDSDHTKEEISLVELQAELSKIGYQVKPFDIVLLQTNADEKWGSPAYFTQYRGVSVEATAWLVAQGVKVIGVDTFGFDAPFNVMLDRYATSKDKDVLWPAHLYGREKEYCQIERLANLSAIPVSFGFKVACFPIKISQCGAGWCRAVALLE